MAKQAKVDVTETRATAERYAILAQLAALELRAIDAAMPNTGKAIARALRTFNYELAGDTENADRAARGEAELRR